MITRKSDINSTPIDFVITWVDGGDSDWLKQKEEYARQSNHEYWSEWVMGESRYRAWGLLKYVFRSFESYAPWFNKVHFITWGHVPNWLNLEHEKLNLVRHEDYIPTDYLPTFNSHVLELNLHRIAGLSEQFVYFNDDTIITRPVKKTDFFKDGLPVDFAGFSPSKLSRTRTAYNAYNTMVINDHFDKASVVKKNPLKWINPKYGPRCLMKTMLLMPFEGFVGFQHDHLPISFLKTTFEEIWRVESKELDSVCRDKFRGFYGLSPWLVRDWQRVSGTFVPSKPDMSAYFKDGFFDKRENAQKIRDAVLGGKHKMLCINDECPDEDFSYWNNYVCDLFEELFPTKSSFEK